MKLKNEQLIKKWEQLRLEAYKPTPNDVWTIGWGHTKGVFPGMKITKETAQQYFEEDTAWAVSAVNTLVRVPLSQNQFDALVSFVFNIGTTQFKKSTLLRKLNVGNYEGAAAEFPRWNKQKGKILKGLVRRRAEEMELFLVPMSSKQSPNRDKTEGPAPFKPIVLSKELAGAVTALVSGVTGFSGGLPLGNSQTLSTTLSVALVIVGLVLVINRIRARKNGDR
jgi:lysozyme